MQVLGTPPPPKNVMEQMEVSNQFNVVMENFAARCRLGYISGFLMVVASGPSLLLTLFSEWFNFVLLENCVFYKTFKLPRSVLDLDSVK